MLRHYGQSFGFSSCIVLMSNVYFSRLHLEPHHPQLHWQRIAVYLKRSALYCATTLVGYALLFRDTSFMYLRFPEQLAVYQGRGAKPVEGVVRDAGAGFMAATVGFPTTGDSPAVWTGVGGGVAVSGVFFYRCHLAHWLGASGHFADLSWISPGPFAALGPALIALLPAAALLMPGYGVPGPLASVMVAHLIVCAYQAWWLKRMGGYGFLSGGQAA